MSNRKSHFLWFVQIEIICIYTLGFMVPPTHFSIFLVLTKCTRVNSSTCKAHLNLHI